MQKKIQKYLHFQKTIRNITLSIITNHKNDIMNNLKQGEKVAIKGTGIEATVINTISGFDAANATQCTIYKLAYKGQLLKNTAGSIWFFAEDLDYTKEQKEHLKVEPKDKQPNDQKLFNIYEDERAEEVDQDWHDRQV